MDSWKQRIIAYISKIDESVSIDNACGLVNRELERLKEEDIKNKENKTTTMIVKPKYNNESETDKSLPIEELVKLFRELFYGRQDVFAVRWDNPKTESHEL
jgi:hypothetical protein